MSSDLLISPSILSADFGRLAEEVKAVDAAGADWIHVDVMDGRFVPNMTIGPLVVKAVAKATAKPLDVHLMIVEPERWIEPFVDAGANLVTVHQEASVHLQRTLMQIKGAGAKAGVSLNPATSEETLRYVAADVDLVLVMSVNPGFGGGRSSWRRNSKKCVGCGRCWMLPEIMPRSSKSTGESQRRTQEISPKRGRRPWSQATRFLAVRRMPTPSPTFDRRGRQGRRGALQRHFEYERRTRHDVEG